MLSIDASIHRIRSYLSRKGVTKDAVAKLAQVHPNTLRSVHEEDWNPRAATLRSLESVVPPDDAASAAAE